ncbi:MAG: hypothetical protein EBZ48_01065 [Proteobacteria bacterium]|nr:hypothetical protein [Pseudomonadota bacterium]
MPISRQTVTRGLYLLLGLGLGVVGDRVVHSHSLLVVDPASLSPEQSHAPSEAADVERCRVELVEARKKVQELSQALARSPSNVEGAVGAEVHGEPAQAAAPANEAIRWRVSAIERFVPITDEQRQRLRAKFTEEQEGTGIEAEKLEDIIGEESAAFYRQQVQAAFQKARQESLEKEVLWVAHQLSLAPEQQEQLRSVFAAVEQQLSAEGLTQQRDSESAQERLKAVMREGRRRGELRNEQLREVLSADQFKQFLKVQAASSDSDVEIFHGAE